MNTRNKFLLAALVGLFLVTLGLAQDAAPVGLPAEASAKVGPDISQAKLPGGIPVAAIVSILATVLTTGVKFAFEKFGSKLKPALVPLVAIAAGFVGDWLGTLTFGTESNGWLALGAGLAAIGINQIKKQTTPDPKAVG